MSSNLNSQQLVTTRQHPESQSTYILLEPGYYPARTGRGFGLVLTTRQELQDLELELRQESSSAIAVDLETRGGDYSDEIEIVGVGLAWDRGSCYIPYRSIPENCQQLLLDIIQSISGRLLAHNVYFDGGVLRRITGSHMEWHACTYALLALLANEGYPGQSWGLKPAQKNLLGWEDSNEHDLHEWLVVHGHYIGVQRTNTDPVHLAEEYRSGKISADRAEMWRAPDEILGKYCLLDAEACYLLYSEVLAPALRKFPGLAEYLPHYMYLISVLVEQKICGIPMHRPGIAARLEELLCRNEELIREFREHPDTREHILEMEQNLRQEHLSREPARLKRDGGVSKNWIKWDTRRSEILQGLHEEYIFNIQSGPQLRELLYQRLGYTAALTTETGEPSVSIRALVGTGGIGKLLVEQAYVKKEIGFLEDYMQRTERRPTVHPSFRSPGTLTGRLSSKEPNMQQIPKTRAMMSLFRCRPGYVWIDLDFAALEPVVLTEFSEDENLMRIYGNTAPKNDIYLYVGAHIPGVGDEIRAAGYDPYNPTPEGLAAAKKNCKALRSVCKTVVLACQYGAGVRKIAATLEADGIHIPYEEVEMIHKTYWSVFSGVREFSQELYREWRRRGGYILNGVGRPMAVPEESTKDLLNRFVQSTGHDILVRYIRVYTEELDRRGIPWTPVIIDFHDASCVEVPEEYRDQTVEVFQWGVDELNRQLGGKIRLRGEADVGYDLADVKQPEE